MKRLLLFLLAASLLAGAFFGAFRLRGLAPSLSGDVYSMLSLGEDLFLVLSDETNNNLAKTRADGSVQSLRRTARTEAYQYAEADGENVFAIRNVYQDRDIRQSIVRLSCASPSMPLETLLDLSGTDVTWKELYLSVDGDPASVAAVGIDGSSHAWFLRYNTTTKERQMDRILGDASVYKLKYVAEGRFLFIDLNGRLNLGIGDKTYPNLLKGRASTPFHISTCGTRCFVSDSITGDLFEIKADGEAVLFHRGTEQICPQSPFLYSDIRLFTTREADGEIQIVAMCPNGDANEILFSGESVLKSLHSGANVLLPTAAADAAKAALSCFAVLGFICLLLREMLFSHRVLVKMTTGTITLTAFLLTGILFVQTGVYEASLELDALKQYKAVSGSLIAALKKAENSPEKERVSAITAEAEDQYRRMTVSVLNQGKETGGGLRNVELGVLILRDGNLLTYYDRSAPRGYQVSDIKKREYMRRLEEVSARKAPLSDVLPTDAVDDFIYIEPWYDQYNKIAGFVSISQPIDDVTADISKMEAGSVVYLALGLLLLLLLALLYRRLLRPLKEIKAGMDSFFENGSGVQILLRDNAPRDEFHDIIRTFNRLSTETRVQMNQLATINGAYARFVPQALLNTLRKRNVQEISPGDCTRLEAGVLLLVPRADAARDRDGAPLKQYLEGFAGQVARYGGFLTDFDEGTGTVTAVFPEEPEKVRLCASNCLNLFPQGMFFAVAHRLSLLVGVWGSPALLLPVAISGEISRLFALLPVFRSLGSLLILTGQAAGTPDESLRRLGTMGEEPPIPFYEDLLLENPARAAIRQKTRPLFEEAAALFEQGRYAESRAQFVRVFRADPSDEAAKWYLFRCEDRMAGETSGQIAP